MNATQARLWGESFSSRELEVLKLVSNGLSNREIAEELYLSIETVKWYNKQMFMKLGVKNRTQAANKAAELNLLSPEQGTPSQEKITLSGNLPAQLTSYVGREKEIGEIKDLLKKNRLVVLTGAGGSGKTRLALKVGEELIDEYSDGVWLVELANIREPSLVLQAIASALNITERTDKPLEKVLKRYLNQRHLLLVIDNLEHLLECAPMIGDLLAAAPRLSVLGTSRERLNIYGEQEYPVAPLNLPGSLSDETSADLLNYESIALFIKRAQAVHPTLSLGDADLAGLARICVRLDGLPLAIELCAPMVKVFPLQVIAERIESSLDAIPSGPRDLPARQQTLRSTIQWSFDLLEENEKRLFIRMAVFNGSGTLQAVEAICGDGISGNIGNILSALVNKNLVLARERKDGKIHFSLLETIRQYGHEKLLASGEADQLAGRHAEYFMQLANQAAVELRGPNQIIWTNHIIAMHDNLRAALEWEIKTGATYASLQFVYDLFEFWLRHGVFEEGRQWLEKVVAMPDAQRYAELYADALVNISWLFWLQGSKEAKPLAEQALRLARGQTNKKITAKALANLGILIFERDLTKAQAYIEESRDICKEIEYEWGYARALMDLGVLLTNQNQIEAARTTYYQSLDSYQKLGDLNFQSVVKRLIGNLEIRQNNLDEGVKAHRESLVLAQLVKNNLQIANNIWYLARVAKAQEDHASAVQMYLASKKIFENMGAWWSGDEPELEEVLKTARAVLGETEFQSVWEAGKIMSTEEAIELALGNPRIP
ncbi:MAG: LuxR C-terminal-related transcriptional regulator [Anaerolineales bacterium]